MRKTYLHLASLVILFIIYYPISAQNIDSVLNIYNDHYQQEKIHIHFDKPVYNKGETIWMKLYLMAGADLSDYSKNIYVDWFTAEGKLLEHQIAPVLQSSAKMQFQIPAAYEGSTLYAVAYTRWMLNFDTAFLYRKAIPVAQAITAKKETPVTSIHFFPEGGNLVNGLLSLVAFKANDQWGNPVKVSGVVVSGNGVMGDSLITLHDGMGSFSIAPKVNETYTVQWKDESGAIHNTALPAALSSGATIELHPMQGRTLFEIKRSETVSDNFKQLNLIATIHGQVVYSSRITLNVKTSVLSQIRTDKLSTGILTFTLFDQQWMPLAERIVFVNNHQYAFYPALSFPVRSQDKRGKNLLQIDMPDSIAANLSVSVTDAGLLSDSSSTILTQFLLSGELRGTIHNPAYYFSGSDDSVAQALDLVMLTHGWRTYKWEDIIAGKLPVLPYPKETDYISIHAKLTDKNYQESAKSTLTLILAAKDNTKEVLLLPGLADTSFSFKNGIFYDSLQLGYELKKNKKSAPITGLNFQTNLLAALPWQAGFNRIPESLPDQLDSNISGKIKEMLDHHDRFTKVKTAETLDEVIVNTRAKTSVQLMDDKYAKGMFSGGNAYQFDLVNDQIASSYPDILTYIQGKAPGLQYGHKSTGTAILTWRGRNTDLYVNEIRTDINNVLNLNVADIAYIKLFPPIFYGNSSGGNGGAVAIYLRDGTESLLSPNTLPIAAVAGYTPYKEFYSPDYSDPKQLYNLDGRTTLYWNPYIITDAKHHCIQIPFYNTYDSKKLRVIIEGVNADGKFARVEKLVE